MMLIFTVERFNSAVHHREAHFCVCPCRQAGGTLLNLMRLVFRDEVIIAMAISHINTYCYLMNAIAIKMLIAKGIYF
ncbi:hypothetical protein MRO53_16165 [Escherichia coli]|nr:hypothetical protein [Escherichia coli]